MRNYFCLLIVCCGILLFKSASAQYTLPDYLDSALRKSPVLIDNNNQLAALALDSQLVHAGYKPRVALTSNSFYAPLINGYGYDEIITNGGNYNALLGVNYAVPLRNQQKTLFDNIRIQKSQLILTARLTERDLQQTVSSQYLTVYGEQQVIYDFEKIIKVLNDENSILKELTQKGVYRQTDYLSFLVSFNQQKLTASQQLLQARNDFYLLNYLCGIADTTYVQLPEPAIKLQPKLFSEQSSAFMQFTYDSLRIANAISLSRFNYKPKLNLLADAGYNSSLLYHAERNFGISAGINLSVPIYDGHQRKIQFDKIRLSANGALQKAAFYRSQFSIKQLRLEQQISETQQVINDFNAQLELADALLKASVKLLETGDLRISEYLLSLTGYMSLTQTLQQLNTSKLQLINEYNYLNY